MKLNDLEFNGQTCIINFMDTNKKDLLFVGMQFLMFFLYLLPINIVNIIIFDSIKYFGLFILFFGVLICLWAIINLNKSLSVFPSPPDNAKLISNGIYKFIRHPIYTGVIFITIGYSIFSESVYRFFISLFLIVLFYLKSKYEEKLLQLKFKEYSSYKKTVGRFLPKIF